MNTNFLYNKILKKLLKLNYLKRFEVYKTKRDYKIPQPRVLVFIFNNKNTTATIVQGSTTVELFPDQGESGIFTRARRDFPSVSPKGQSA